MWKAKEEFLWFKEGTRFSDNDISSNPNWKKHCEKLDNDIPTKDTENKESQIEVDTKPKVQVKRVLRKRKK